MLRRVVAIHYCSNSSVMRFNGHNSGVIGIRKKMDKFRFTVFLYDQMCIMAMSPRNEHAIFI